MKKLSMPAGINVGERRQQEGDAHKGFKKSGAGAQTIRPSGKARKHAAK